MTILVVVTENGTMDSLLNHQATENPHRVSFVYTSCALGIH